MPQDTYTLRLIARELDATLKGGRVNKINQPRREELSLLIYTQNKTFKLCINANASECGVYFTEDAGENPLVAPNFCMLLRKHLTGAEILGVEMPTFERILWIRFLCHSDFSSSERVLRCEIMGKYSNLILTENDVILGALKTTAIDENLRRAILPGVKYLPPAPQDKINPENSAALKALFSAPPEGDLARFLFLHVAGLAPSTAEQIVSSFSGGDFSEHVRHFIFSDEISPCVVFLNGAPSDFSARYVFGALPFPTLSAAQSYYYEKKRAARTLDQKRRSLLSCILAAEKKQEKNLLQIREKQLECASFEENRIKGELLTANLHALSQGQNSCELLNYYDPENRTIFIALDRTISPAENAQNYFKKYKKQRRTIESLAPREKDAEEELAYLKTLRAAAESAQTIEDLLSLEEELALCNLIKEQSVRKKNAPIPFRSYEEDGFRILAGRNNLQNDKLVKRSSPEDLWLHTQKFHSCHVVVETNGRDVPEKVLLYAAKICARFSDARGGGKVPVDYCKIKFVKKPHGARAGFVVYTDFKTVLVDVADL